MKISFLHRPHLHIVYDSTKQKILKQETVPGFVYLSKAFDSVDHSLLWHKLRNVGIHGRMLHIIQSMYLGLKSCFRINEKFTDWFSFFKGVRQGDNTAPTLFALFINDLIPRINSINNGITLDDEFSLNALLYADEIVLLSSNADGLQSQLDVLNNWSNKCTLNVNIDKTKILHVRKVSQSRSDYDFKLGYTPVDYVPQYRYLGFTLGETLDYSIGVKELLTASSRDLGSLVPKFFYTGWYGL